MGSSAASAVDDRAGANGALANMMYVRGLPVEVKKARRQLSVREAQKKYFIRKKSLVSGYFMFFLSLGSNKHVHRLGTARMQDPAWHVIRKTIACKLRI
jgi:hypothetical protein